ncbi:MAG: hypothetical protein WCA81_18045 [Rhizomicrobium sp.]
MRDFACRKALEIGLFYAEWKTLSRWRCNRGRSAMSHAGWGDVWNLALTVVRAQTVPIQILIGLSAAFVAVMALEGLRASFMPGYRAQPHHPYVRSTAASAPPAPKVKASAVETTSLMTPVPFRPRQRSNHIPKRMKLHVSRHSAARPTIRRVSSGAFTNSFLQTLEQNPASTPAFTEDAAPFSPLPPIVQQTEV